MFVKLKRLSNSVPIWVNPDLITTINASSSFGSSKVWSRVFTADGYPMEIDMKPEDLMEEIRKAKEG